VTQVELNKKVEIEVDRGGKPVKLTAAIKEAPVDYKTTRVNPRESPAPPAGRRSRSPTSRRMRRASWRPSKWASLLRTWRAVSIFQKGCGCDGDKVSDDEANCARAT